MSRWHGSVVASVLRDICNASAIDPQINRKIPPEVRCPRNNKAPYRLRTRWRTGFRARFWFGRGWLVHCSFRRRRVLLLRQLLFLRWRRPDQLLFLGWRRRGRFFYFHDRRRKPMRCAQEQYHDREKTKDATQDRHVTAQITPR